MDSIPLVSYISTIYSRLSYFNPIDYNIYYSNIFSSKNKTFYNQLHLLDNQDNLFGIPSKSIIENNKIINKILYSKRTYHANSDFKFFSISNSNYSSSFITANRVMNTIIISFRGTYSLKSGLSYAKLSSAFPVFLCDDQGVLIGIFKIIFEIYNTIIQAIDYLGSHFLKTNPTIITTGHSLGGACATIFSYLYQLNVKKKIYCITFGAPRVFNYELIKVYNSYILKNKIMFHRYVTNGDPFPKLPPNIKGLTTNTFFHPDDRETMLDGSSYLCKNQTKKIKCSLKSKTHKRKSNIKYHGNYIGISYKDAANNLKNLNKEIRRNKFMDTICRLTESKGSEIESVFYNQEYLKKKDIDKQKKIRKIMDKVEKTFIRVSLLGDIYMDKKQFLYLIKNMTEMKSNLLTTQNYIVPLQINTPSLIKYCHL